jgi:methionyl-tRNA formyltransferase
MIIEILNTKPVPVEQTGEVVLFKRRKPEESHLENAKSINKAFDMIRMLDAKGYPHAFIETSNLKFEFKQVKQIDGQLEAKVIIREIISEKEV